jgi:uracil phosphoribosyltransferase
MYQVELVNINRALTALILTLLISISLISSSSATVADNQVVDLSEYPNLHIIDHSLIKSKLTIMREKKTSSQEFRRLVSEIAMLMTYESTKNLPIKDVDIETQNSKAKGQKLKNNLVIVPILRAGLGMLDGIQKIIPEADVAHIGMFKDHLTKRAVEYLSKMPEVKDQIFIVTDPEIASGNSAIGTIDRLVKNGVSTDKIIFMSLIVVSEGVEKFHSKFPMIPLYAAAIDEKVNEQTSVSTGTGDIGDRLYGTKVNDRSAGCR